jgi:hypothetical protein
MVKGLAACKRLCTSASSNLHSHLRIIQHMPDAKRQRITIGLQPVESQDQEHPETAQ